MQCLWLVLGAAAVRGLAKLRIERKGGLAWTRGRGTIKGERVPDVFLWRHMECVKIENLQV